MQEVKNRVVSEKYALNHQVVWRERLESDHGYVHRCSFCGKFKRVLLAHWFYTGLYCVACVNDVLYDNARKYQEVRND